MRRRDKPIDIHRKLDLLRVPITSSSSLSSSIPVSITNTAIHTTTIDSNEPELAATENVSIHSFMHSFIHKCIYILIYMYMYTYTYMYVCMYVYGCMYTYTYMYVCISYMIKYIRHHFND